MKSKFVNISVIMPAYNASNCIDAAIRSVLSQKGVSFELLIGDDGSTDGTKARLLAYKTEPRIRPFFFRKNRGVSHTSNRLIGQARGKYIACCDADDIMLPGNLRILSSFLDKDPSVGAAYSDILVRPRAGKEWIKRRFDPSQSWDLLGGCFANGGTLIRRSLIQKVGGYKTQLSFLEDCDLFLRLSDITTFHYFAGKPLYLQKQTQGSLSDQPSKVVKGTSQNLLRSAIQRRYGIKVKW